MTRRAWIAAVGLGAAAAGTGLSWWHGRTGPAASPWDLRFPRPEGGELALAGLRGRPLVLNFWATWCPPCVREMPQLNRFAKEFGAAGWQVLGLAVDQAEPVRAFLKTMAIDFPVALGGAQALSLSRDLGNAGGGLPFTVLFDAHGQVLRRRLGETHFDELAAWARQPRQSSLAHPARVPPQGLLFLRAEKTA